MSVDLILIIVVIVLGFLSLGFLMFHLFKQRQSDQPEQLENLINQVFGMSSQKIAEQSKHILQSEKEAIHVDLENKQKVIEKLVNDLKTELKSRQEEIRLLEQDRVQKFGEITIAIDSHRKLTEKLETTTQQLAKVLSNNQTRGAWGERIIEDILQSNGLQEGIHFRKQSIMASSGLKPDIVLILPDNRFVAVDVKFPYSEIQKMAVAETQKAKEEHEKQFARDLKSKITKVAEYINPEDDTLDYSILFVPNEMVFSYINQKFPDLVDEAISQGVIIVSPFTFLVVARTVRESYRNFIMEGKLKEVIKHINSFTGEYVRFKDQFLKYGRSIETLKKSYDDMANTRFNQMDRKLAKIDESQQAGLLSGKTEAQLNILEESLE